MQGMHEMKETAQQRKGKKKTFKKKYMNVLME